MNFSFLTPLAPVPGYPFLGGWGGQNFFAHSGCCVWIWTQVQGNLFLVHGPPNPWRGSRVRTLGTPGPPPPPYGPLLVRTPARFPKFDFFGNPSVAPGMGLGDDLVTIRVLEHPWGPT